MDETNKQNQDPFRDLKKKQDSLSKELAKWIKDIKDPGKDPNNADRMNALNRINKLLGLIKSEINVYWGPGIKADHEVRLLIADKKTNPYNKQVEDIEGDVYRLEGI